MLFLNLTLNPSVNLEYVVNMSFHDHYQQIGPIWEYTDRYDHAELVVDFVTTAAIYAAELNLTNVLIESDSPLTAEIVQMLKIFGISAYIVTVDGFVKL